MGTRDLVKQKKSTSFAIGQLVIVEVCFFILALLLLHLKVPKLVILIALIIFSALSLLPYHGNNLLSRISKIYKYTHRGNHLPAYLSQEDLDDYIIANNQVFSVFWMEQQLVCLLKYRPFNQVNITNNSQLACLDLNSLIKYLNNFDVKLSDISLQTFLTKNTRSFSQNNLVLQQETYLALKLDPTQNQLAIQRHGGDSAAVKNILIYSAYRLIEKLKLQNIHFVGLNSQETKNYLEKSSSLVKNPPQEAWGHITQNNITYSVYTCDNQLKLIEILNSLRATATGNIVFKIQFSQDNRGEQSINTLILLENNKNNQMFPNLQLLVGQQLPSFLDTYLIANRLAFSNKKTISGNELVNSKLKLQANGCFLGTNLSNQIIGIEFTAEAKITLNFINKFSLLQDLAGRLVENKHKILIIDNNYQKWGKLLETISNPRKLGFSPSDRIPNQKVLQLFDTLILADTSIPVPNYWSGNTIKLTTSMPSFTTNDHQVSLINIEPNKSKSRLDTILVWPGGKENIYAGK